MFHERHSKRSDAVSALACDEPLLSTFGKVGGVKATLRSGLQGGQQPFHNLASFMISSATQCTQSTRNHIWPASTLSYGKWQTLHRCSSNCRNPAHSKSSAPLRQYFDLNWQSFSSSGLIRLHPCYFTNEVSCVAKVSQVASSEYILGHSATSHTL